MTWVYKHIERQREPTPDQEMYSAQGHRLVPPTGGFTLPTGPRAGELLADFLNAEGIEEFVLLGYSGNADVDILYRT